MKLALALAVGAAFAQPTGQDGGPALAATCANCHGTNGVAEGAIPSLAGMPKEDIVAAMKAFRAGTRPATVMQQLARGYTDDEIDALAAWFAAQRRR